MLPRAIDLRGRSIVITGASSGIGAATALACAHAGMHVALAARRKDRIEALAGRINAAGGRAVAVPTDVDDPDACRELVRGARQSLGSLHAVLANAGYGIEKNTHELTDEEIAAIFRTNFFGTLHVLRPAVELFLEQGSGHALICASALSKIGTPYLAAYSASKAMQDHFGRAMRVELAPKGIFVSTIHPIRTATEFSRSVVRRSGEDRRSPQPPRGMIQTAEHVAEQIVRCLQRPRPEVWPSTTARLAMALATACPRLADAALARLLKKPS